MENKINKIVGVIILAFLVFGLFIIFYRHNQLEKNFKIAEGRVSEVQASGWKNSPGDCAVLYEYFVNGKKYENNNNYNFCNNLSLQRIKLLLERKSFPVAFAVNAPSAGVMIIKKEEAERFNYLIPDSMLVYDSVLTCK